MEKNLVISIGVMSCTTKDNYRQELLSCLETWIPECENVFCFAGDSSLDKDKIKSDKIIYLDGITDDYESVSDKQWLGFEWMYKNINADFYCIIGTDNYVREDNLKKMLLKYNPDEKFLISGYLQTRYANKRLIAFPFGGAGLILSRAAMKALSPDFSNYKKLWPKDCDNPEYNNACDIAISYYCEINKVVLVRDYDVYSVNYLDFFKNRNILNTGKIDYDNAAIFHYMTKHDMDMYHKIKHNPLHYVELFNYVRYNRNYFYNLGLKACKIFIRRKLDEIHLKNIVLGMLDNLKPNLVIHCLHLSELIEIYPDIVNLGIELKDIEEEKSYYDNVII